MTYAINNECLRAQAARYGLTSEETDTIRAAQITLSQWAERAGVGELEQDAATGKWMSVHTGRNGCRILRPVADKTAGARRQIQSAVDARNARLAHCAPLMVYHEADICAHRVYLVSEEFIPRGETIGEYYFLGLAICD